MNGKQTATAAAGAGLIAANFWLGPARHTVTSGMFGSGDVNAAHAELKKLAAEILFVAVATLVAGMGPQAGTAMVAIIAALFVLWAINRYAPNQ